MAPLLNGRTRRTGRRAFWLTSLLLILTSPLFMPTPAQAWGSITHIAICRKVSASPDFIAGGHSPDMIALNSVATGSGAYDYAHNLNAEGGSFGYVMTGRGGGSYAQGWLAHQLADSVVHGANGYSETKTIIKGLPQRYTIDLGHGTTELIVDAIVLKEVFNRSLSIFVPDKIRLIHETAVACYNNAGGRIPRGNIISCQLAEGLAIEWGAWLNTNLYIADLMIDEPWFMQAEKDYQDFRPLFEYSIDLIRDKTAATSKQTEPAGWLDLLVGVLVPAQQVRAAETSPDDERTAYYSFVMKLSKRAREIGGGEITKESVKQAIAETENTAGFSDEEKVWARTIREMTVKDNRDLSAIEKKVTVYGKELGPKQGAVGGRTGAGFLPCLSLILLFSLMATGLYWFARRIVERR